MLPLHLLCSESGPMVFSLECDHAAGHGHKRLYQSSSICYLRRTRSATDLGAEESRSNFPPKLVRSNSMPPSRRKRRNTDRWASSSQLNNRWESEGKNESNSFKLGGDSPPVLPRGDASRDEMYRGDTAPVLPRADRNPHPPARKYSLSPPIRKQGFAATLVSRAA